MAVPAQFPNFINPQWVVFIKDNAFSTLYDVYIRNFDAKSSYQKEYSVIWFRQIWHTLCALARQNHSMSMGVEDIENNYNPQRPLYGKILYETKRIYSHHDGNIYNLLIVDDFNYTIPYIDVYGGKRVRLSENTTDNDKIILTETQLRSIIQDCISKVLKEQYKDSKFFGWDFRENEFKKGGADKSTLKKLKAAYDRYGEECAARGESPNAMEFDSWRTKKDIEWCDKGKGPKFPDYL